MKYEGWAIGQTIKDLRKDAHMTIEQLSEIVDKSVSHISQLEQGGRRMSIDLLFQLTEALNTDANTILGIRRENNEKNISNTKNDEVSIDKALDRLSTDMKEYLTRTFFNMINDATNMEKDKEWRQA